MASPEDPPVIKGGEETQTPANPRDSHTTANPETSQSWADETTAAATESKSTHTEPKSSEDTEKPSEDTGKPSEDAANPSEDAGKPSEDTAKPSEDAAKPKSKMEDVSEAQTDGASGRLGGGSGIYESNYEVDVKLSDLQSDTSNPLYSIKSFEELGLDPKILQGIYQMRFTKPSKIQEKALPLLLNNPPQNLIGQSQSGTGKTAAFVLNILARLDLSGSMAQAPQALVLAPSRELARQIVGVCQVMGQSLPELKVEAAIPVERADRGRQIQASIVVGTPGTTTDLIKRRQLNAQNLKVLVLDEADNMLDQQGLGDQCHRVKQMLPRNVQVVLFSATFPDAVVEFATRFAPNSNQITLRHEELTVEGIRQLYLDCPSERDKFQALVRLYGLMTIGSSIIFVRTRATALALERSLNEDGHTVSCLTGEFEGKQRDMLIDSFRSGQSKVLITTNVLSRGIDVQTVSLVVNYDLPDDGRGSVDPQTYLHRIGRTGRFGRVGVSISFISGSRDYRMLKEIEEYFDVKMIALPNDDWDAVEETIKKVIKSSRAGANFQTANDATSMKM